MKLKTTLLAITISALVSAPAFAQDFGEEWNWGARTGFYLDEGDAFLGVEAATPITDALWFNPNIEWVFIDGGDLATINADVTYTLDGDGDVFWWAGAGLAGVYENFAGSEFDLGFNVLAGAGYIIDDWLVYAQAKALFSDADDDVAVSVGVRF